jgi:plasmid replication initiation protein
MEVVMATKKIPFPDTIVKKSNAIARAMWSPKSVWESRIVALVASKVREEDEDFYTYQIPIVELSGVPDEKLSGEKYKQICDSIYHLKKAIICIQGSKPRNFRTYNLFSMCGYEDGNLIARFDPDLKPHYLNLKKHFTEYSLTVFLLLPSIYSQRLYEILKSWDDRPETTINVTDLHAMLEVPSSLKKDFAAFRRRVLEKSYTDITKHTDLKYDWEPIKKGRKVIAVRFTFAQNRTQKLAKEKQLKRQRANSQRNNKLGVAAVKCFESHGKVCNQENPNTKQVCEVCKMLHPK